MHARRRACADTQEGMLSSERRARKTTSQRKVGSKFQRSEWKLARESRVRALTRQRGKGKNSQINEKKGYRRDTGMRKDLQVRENPTIHDSEERKRSSQFRGESCHPVRALSDALIASRSVCCARDAAARRLPVRARVVRVDRLHFLPHVAQAALLAEFLKTYMGRGAGRSSGQVQAEMPPAEACMASLV
eukprot:3341279-Pleurochrysis_carterae.AAC.7